MTSGYWPDEADELPLLADAVRRPEQQQPVEFRQDHEPRVRVVGIPDPGRLPDPVADALVALAQACHDAYGMGVEVEGETGRDAARSAVETLRRYLA